MSGKVCPIMSKITWKGLKLEDWGLHETQCLAQECACWDEKLKRCAFVSIGSIAKILYTSTTPSTNSTTAWRGG